jgi:hypothetical protein
MAVGEGNYGRLTQQQRYTTANARSQRAGVASLSVGDRHDVDDPCWSIGGLDVVVASQREWPGQEECGAAGECRKVPAGADDVPPVDLGPRFPGVDSEVC